MKKLFILGCVYCLAALANMTEADKDFEQGNYKDALGKYLAVMYDGKQPIQDVEKSIDRTHACLSRLNKFEQWDEIMDRALSVHNNNWKIVMTFSRLLTRVPHNGRISEQKFLRNPRGGAGRWVSVYERDRVYSLYLMAQAIPGVDANGTQLEKRAFYQLFADLLMEERHYDAWKLQILTDLSKKPDWELASGDDCRCTGAPVDADGNPLFYAVPATWSDAKNDGERWRWALAQLAKNGAADRATLDYANFLKNQFDVEQIGGFLRDSKSIGLMTMLAELKDDETITRLATGIKRITLPQEHAFIKLYKSIPQGSGKYKDACYALGTIYENRRQYDEAAKYYELSQLNNWQDKVSAIKDDWCEIQPEQPMAAGKEASFELRYRNSKQVTLRCWKVDMPAIVSAFNKKVVSEAERNFYGISLSEPMRWIVLNDKGEELSEKDWRYLAKPIKWTAQLQPKEKHFDTYTRLQLPVKVPGVYMVEARTGANVHYKCFVIEGAKIVTKPMDGANYWQILRSSDGKPLANTQVKILAWARDWSYKTKKTTVFKENRTLTTDGNGIVYLSDLPKRDDLGWSVVIEATDAECGYVFYSSYMHNSRGHHDIFGRMREYAVSDRPVYHPGDTVHFKLWLTDARYGDESNNSFAGQKQTFRLNGPDWKKLHEEDHLLDEYGAMEVSWVIPADAKLGRYTFGAKLNSGSFRIEEYRKPEFEVLIDAPNEPIALGDKAKLTLRAKYYFGMPVNDAEVSVKIERKRKENEWWPIGYWDWFYGIGYGWLWENYLWYPGWAKWGCCCPHPIWWHRSFEAPELISELNGKIEADGTYSILLDTESAKMLYGDCDHEYTITAEVRDKSRKTIVGNGRVMACRQPFSVYATQDYGFYFVGKQINVYFVSRTADGKPVDGAGTVRLFRIKYDKDGIPKETLLSEKAVAFNDGRTRANYIAAEPGQYRVSCTLTDAKGRSVEGASIIAVRGEKMEVGDDFRWNELELVPEKSEYKPGEKLRLAVNTAHKGSTVMLFPRAENGVVGRPVVLHLEQGSTVYETEIKESDMPNIVFEAYCVSDAKVHNVARDIVVPPVKRVLNVEAVPDKANVKPGTTDKLAVRVTDAEGKPHKGALTIAVYDRSVDAIAPDCIPGDIRQVFWKWRRSHSPHVNAFGWAMYNLYFGNIKQMPQLSMFEQLATRMDDEMSGSDGSDGIMALGVAANGGVRERRMMAGAKSAMMVAESAPMMAAAPAPKTMALNGMMDRAEAAEDVAFAAEVADKEGGDGQINVRSNFADTALWVGQVITDENGVAQVDVPLPESLTTWKICVWAIGNKSAAGYGNAEVITSKDLMVRLEAQRFLVENDEAIISALVNSKLPGTSDVEVTLEVLEGNLKLKSNEKCKLKVQENGDARADWKVFATGEGEAKLRVVASCKKQDGTKDGDGMEATLSVLVHGSEILVSMPAVMKTQEAEWKKEFSVPQKIKQNSAELTVNWSPSLALAMVDALPYLVSFEYENTESTLNRFLPALVVRETLSKLGMSLSDIAQHKSNLNSQQLGGTRYAKDALDPGVFSDAELNIIINKNLRHLMEMQCNDGGWGWFSGYGEHSWADTTLQVVRGLLLAKQYGCAVDKRALERGIQWLESYRSRRLAELKDTEKKYQASALDAYVQFVLALAGKNNAEMSNFLWRDKNELPVFGKVLFARALCETKDARLDDVMKNISQFAVNDDENQTSYLDVGSYWWYWYCDENETMANWLSLLVKVGKDTETPARLVKYLLNNRKNKCRWRSTRDTAACLEAFAEYIVATKENKVDMLVEIVLDGKRIATSQLTPANLFNAQLTAVVPELKSGKHELTVRKVGNGPLYINAYASYFSQEDFIKRQGLEIKVTRNVYKIMQGNEQAYGVNTQGNAVGKKVSKETAVLLKEGAYVNSGDVLEVELVLESKNDYEYIVVEDFRAGGTEPLESQSGYKYSGGIFAYMEYRATKTAAFIRSLNRGKSSITYRLRAENPGFYSALPTVVSGMYAPELRANSDEHKITVK